MFIFQNRVGGGIEWKAEERAKRLWEGGEGCVGGWGGEWRQGKRADGGVGKTGGLGIGD
jgi:hypothetical protein